MTGPRNPSGANNPLLEEIRKSVNTLKTAAEMMQVTSQSQDRTATLMARASKDNSGAIEDLVSSIGQMVAPGQYGRPMGGTTTAGPMLGRVSGQHGYQMPRPGSWGAHGYPGGTGYGMGFQGGGAVPLGHSGPGTGMSTLRQRAAMAVHQNFGTGQYSYHKTDQSDASGNPIWEARPAGGGAPITGTAEQVNQAVRSSGRGIMSSLAGGAGDFGHGIGGQLGGMRSALGGMAERGGLMGGAAGLGMRAIPVVGTAVAIGDAAYKGAQFIGEQRQQNAAYQSIYGGSSNMGLGENSGFGQRIRQEGYKLGQMFTGGLSGSQADQAFKGVSALGYGGGQRQQALDFVSSNYKSMGMSVPDSMQLIDTASRNLTTSLGQLHTELQAVSQVAKDTGQSAQTLRQSFAQNFGVTTAMGAGATAGTLAQALTTGTTGSGRLFANTSVSGMIGSLGQQTITAAYGGFAGAGQMAAAQQSNPTAVTRGIDRRVQSALNASVPQNVRTLIEGKIKAAGGPQILRQFGGDNLAVQIGQDPDVVNSLNPLSVDAILSSQHITHDSTNIPKMYGLLVSQIGVQMQGGYTALAAAADQPNRQQTGAVATKQLMQQQANNILGGNGMSSMIQNAKTGNLPIDYSTVKGKIVEDPAIAKLKTMIGENGQVQVQTGDGPRIMSLKEASQKYRDQLVDGSATVVKTGKTVAESGISPEINAKYANSKKVKDPKGYSFGKESAAIAKLGLTGKELDTLHSQLSYGKSWSDKEILDEAKKIKKKGDDKDAKAATKGEIKLYMTPELKKWIGVDYSGPTSTTDDAATSGAPVTTPNTGPSWSR